MLLLFAACLVYGSVFIPFDAVIKILAGKAVERTAWQSIVLQSRLPQAATAVLAGSALAVSGLLLQTFFRNPLAGPSILGISDGANLGVAAVILLAGNPGQYFLGGYWAVIPAAFAGAGGVMALIIYFSAKVRNSVMLLIIGIMIGYLASSAISVLNYYATADRVHSYVMWGMGNFSSISLERLPLFAVCTVVGLAFSVMLIKPLNALLLGETYAANLGVNVRSVRMQILLCTGFLAAVTTAFCGPVSFIGLAVPHVARLLLGSSNHRQLLPVTLLAGACVALLCNLLMVVPGAGTVLPLNAVTPWVGAPIIIYVIASKKHIHYFNEA
ncbi:MAG: iron ABC transporter permease [Tannerellaceae bacterium]|jgi:iron complex transport system permease protein|nr:iron ABC transporter permease [Tannerellaceae bacterium]